MDYKQQQRLADFTTLSANNKNILLQLRSTLLNRNQIIIIPQIANFQQIKLQYDFILAISRESISKNYRLQQQVDKKQDQVRVLHQKLQRQSQHIEGLDEQISIMTVSLKKDQKMIKQIKKASDHHEKLMDQIHRLNQIKNNLIAQDQQWRQKEEQIRLLLKNRQKELQNTNLSHEQYQKRWQQRISELQKQINYQKNLLLQLRQFSNKSTIGSAKNKKLKTLQDLHLMIRKHREEESF